MRPLPPLLLLPWRSLISPPFPPPPPPRLLPLASISSSNRFADLISFSTSSPTLAGAPRRPFPSRDPGKPRRSAQVLFSRSSRSWCLDLCCSRHCSNKGRPSRAQKTDEELCQELREFASSLGLPGDSVPSLKELTQNGRKDLANIVRRRGYKAIKELLGFSTGRENMSSETANAQEDAAASIIMIENAEAEDITTTVSLVCASSNDPTVEEKIAVQEDYPNIIANKNAVQEATTSVPLMCTSSNNPMLEKEITVQANGTVVATNDSEVNQFSKYSVESLQLKSAKFVQSGELDTLEDEDGNSNVDVISKEQPNESEINRLKLLLHEKELELAQLKQLLENEKISLYDLQAKAKADVDDIQRNVAEKDVELQACEENLSGLKEVHIEFYANAQTVEIAGSFNGWHHRVTMDPHPQSESEATDGDRMPQLWSAILWLYPGLYEIKFVVDGHWRIDSQREIVTSGNVTNNVMRVS